MKLSHQIGYWLISGRLCAWAVFFALRQTYAMSNQEAKMKLDTTCIPGQVMVDISNLNFSIDPSWSQQHASWERLTGWYHSSYYGSMIFSWVVVEDTNANCNIQWQEGSASDNALRYLTMSAGNFNASDQQTTYILTPSEQADPSFDYADKQSNIHFVIRDNPLLWIISGSQSQQLIEEGDISVMDTGSVGSLEKYVIKREIKWWDQRKTIMQYIPTIELSLPTNMPSLPFQWSMYINLYALAHGDNTRLGGSTEQETGNTSTWSTWPTTLPELEQLARQKASQLDSLTNKEHNNFIIGMRNLYRQGEITKDIYNNLRKNKYEKYLNKTQKDYEKNKLTEKEYREILQSIINTIDLLL